MYGFRVWKGYVRKFSDQIILDNYNIDLHARNNIIKLQSLVHNQLSSPKYTNLFAYSWYKSGYVDTKPEHFEHPVTFAFATFQDQYSVRCSVCGERARIRCSWCNEAFCFKHFFDEYHYHRS